MNNKYENPELLIARMNELRNLQPEKDYTKRAPRPAVDSVNDTIENLSKRWNRHDRVRQEMGLDFDQPEDPYKDVRNALREKFIKRAYRLAFRIMNRMAKVDKLDEAPLKDLATALGIIMDKALIASGKFEEKRTMEYAAITEMSDENLENFIGRAQGAISFLSQRRPSTSRTREPEESS